MPVLQLLHKVSYRISAPRSVLRPGEGPGQHRLSCQGNVDVMRSEIIFGKNTNTNTNCSSQGITRHLPLLLYKKGLKSKCGSGKQKRLRTCHVWKQMWPPPVPADPFLISSGTERQIGPPAASGGASPPCLVSKRLLVSRNPHPDFGFFLKIRSGIPQLWSPCLNSCFDSFYLHPFPLECHPLVQFK